MRYVIPGGDTELLEEIKGPVIHVNHVSDGNIHLYVLHDEFGEPRPRRFRVFETGESTDGYMYLGTVMVGTQARHVFEFDEVTWQALTTDVSAQNVGNEESQFLPLPTEEVKLTA